MDEIEEKNRKLKQQLDDQKEIKRKLELEQQQQQVHEHQSRLFKNISNKKITTCVQPRQTSQTRSPSVNVQPLVQPKLNDKPAFQTTQFRSNEQPVKFENVALINLTPRDSTPPKSKELKKQVIFLLGGSMH